MQKLLLPELSGEFKQIGACAIVSLSDKHLVRWVEENAVRSAVANYDERGEPRWIEFTFETWDDETVHMHVELKSDDPGPGTNSLTFDQICDQIASFLERIGDHECFIRSCGRLVVDRSAIPEDGPMGTLLEYSGESCGSDFALEGASLRIGDELFYKMSFRHDIGENAVYVELFAENESPLHIGYLLDFMELMETGARCFVFEDTSREQTHAK